MTIKASAGAYLKQYEHAYTIISFLEIHPTGMLAHFIQGDT